MRRAERQGGALMHQDHPCPISPRRNFLRFLLALGATALALAPSAFASPHVFSFSITGTGSSQLSNPSAVAVDNSNDSSAHDIYVADTRHFRVEKFNPDGTFLLMFGRGVNKTKVEEGRPEAEQNVCAAGESCQSGTAGESPGSFLDPEHVAIDGSTGPSGGDVYVADSEGRRVSKFGPFGHLITTWGTNGQIEIEHEGISGIAVDPNGNLYIMEYAGSTLIAEYTQGGTYVSSILTGYSGLGIAVDGSGDIYIATEQGDVEKYSSSGTDLGSLESSARPVALALNPSNDRLYVGEIVPDRIREFAASCTIPDCSPLATFGEGDIHFSDTYQIGGLASDDSDETLYSTGPDYGSGPVLGEVAVLLPAGLVPDVTTGSSQSEHPNMVAGYVDPENAGAVTSCEFEYVARELFNVSRFELAKLAPCTPPPPYLDPTDVLAELPKLQADTSYTYRLVASNSHGSGTGTDSTLATLGSPAATTGLALSIHETSATVYGTVGGEASNIVSGCTVEYVDQTAYSSSGYAAASSAPCSPPPPYSTATEVSADLANLVPGTTYHYRVTAANVERSTAGEDGVFSTLPFKPEAMPEEESKHRPVRVGRVHCSRRPCSRSLQGSTRVKRWSSPRFPPGYGTTFAVFVKGHSLQASDVAEHCIATFRGPALIATLNECHGKFRLIYLGSGPFKIRWRVFP